MRRNCSRQSCVSAVQPYILHSGFTVWRLQHSSNPDGSEAANALAGLVAEDDGGIRLLLAIGLQLQPFEHGSQPRRGEWHNPSLAALGCLGAEHDQLTVQSTSPTRSASIAPTHAGVQGCDDQGPQQGLRHLEQPRLLVLGQASVSAVVFPQLANEGFCSGSERRPIEVLPTDRPVQHVLKQLDGPIDRGVRQGPRFALAVDDAPLPKIGDEIFDVGGAYFNDPDDRRNGRGGLQPIVISFATSRGIIRRRTTAGAHGTTLRLSTCD
jgi:hypothetical protein